MTRYFFHLHECGSVTQDPKGRDFPSLDDARTAAVADAHAIMCDELSHGNLCLSCHIEISGADGECIERVLFSDSVKVTGQPTN